MIPISLKKTAECTKKELKQAYKEPRQLEAQVLIKTESERLSVTQCNVDFTLYYTNCYNDGSYYYT